MARKAQLEDVPPIQNHVGDHVVEHVLGLKPLSADVLKAMYQSPGLLTTGLETAAERLDDNKCPEVRAKMGHLGRIARRFADAHSTDFDRVIGISTAEIPVSIGSVRRKPTGPRAQD